MLSCLSKNPRIFIESWGRGTLEIVNQCLEQEVQEPDFIEEYGVFKLMTLDYF